MSLLRELLDRAGRPFHPGGRLEKLYPLYEAVDTLFYTPSRVTRTGAHVRDAVDLKRMMTLVVLATLPCVLWGLYNTGLQANLALDPSKAAQLDDWRHRAVAALGFGFSPSSIADCVALGLASFLPLYAVTMAVGLAWEILFAIVRKEEVNEGFFVTGILFPLICPPELPLWQAALGISFGIVVAKEVFGGTGMNFINPALAARAFLFFAYPSAMTGDAAWTALPPAAAIDGWSGATLLSQMHAHAVPPDLSAQAWWRAFVGLEPGSLGETSALACLVGAALMLATRVASWRIMAGVVLGTIAMSLVLNALAAPDRPYFALPFWWHMVAGGWAFGAVFMATDPVTAPFTERGRLLYGVLIGVLVVMTRVLNPAYPESMMLVILFMNVVAPVIDHVEIRANARRRAQRRAMPPPAGGTAP